jgi:hypothetical protein
MKHGSRGLHFVGAARLALAGITLHSLIDFPFREPAIWLTTCLLLGFYTARSPTDARSPRTEATS